MSKPIRLLTGSILALNFQTYLAARNYSPESLDRICRNLGARTRESQERLNRLARGFGLLTVGAVVASLGLSIPLPGLPSIGAAANEFLAYYLFVSWIGIVAISVQFWNQQYYRAMLEAAARLLNGKFGESYPPTFDSAEWSVDDLSTKVPMELANGVYAKRISTSHRRELFAVYAAGGGVFAAVLAFFLGAIGLSAWKVLVGQPWSALQYIACLFLVLNFGALVFAVLPGFPSAKYSDAFLAAKVTSSQPIDPGD